MTDLHMERSICASKSAHKTTWQIFIVGVFFDDFAICTRLYNLTRADISFHRSDKSMPTEFKTTFHKILPYLLDIHYGDTITSLRISQYWYTLSRAWCQKEQGHEAWTSCLLSRRQTTFADRYAEGRVSLRLFTCPFREHRLGLPSRWKITPKTRSSTHLPDHHPFKNPFPASTHPLFASVFRPPNLPGLLHPQAIYLPLLWTYRDTIYHHHPSQIWMSWAWARPQKDRAQKKPLLAAVSTPILSC